MYHEVAYEHYCRRGDIRDLGKRNVGYSVEISHEETDVDCFINIFVHVKKMDFSEVLLLHLMKYRKNFANI